MTKARRSPRRRLLAAAARARFGVRRRVRRGYRWPLGVLIMLLGFLGFLPVLGFWMIPFGILVIAMDLRPLWRRRRRGLGG